MSEQASFFGAAQPSFARMDRVAGRVAVVDVGSNSVRLVVFDGAARSPAYFFNEKMSCGLGAGIAESGRLNPAGRVRALDTLRRFAALAERMRVGALEAVATAAMREAEDGQAFRDQVERETGLRLRVISGEEEARLSALGVLLGEPGARGVAADMGGASLELARLDPGGVGPRVTLGLGPQRLAGFEGAALRKRIDGEVERGAAVADAKGETLYIVGGSWRAVAKVQMARRDHPLQVLQGYSMAADEAAEACEWIAAQSPDTLKSMADISSARAAVAPLAALVLGRLIARLKPSAVSVSAFGLREGVYFERLPDVVRRADPLLETARLLEQAQARFPGFGEELAVWIAPLTAHWPVEERRLARAACLLNDVNWRAHPDYRAVSCFETVTRANLAGLDHAARVWIGLALMMRYGGPKGEADLGGALELLDAAQFSRAEGLGRALRLGAMISASTPGALSHAPLRLGAGVLGLRLDASLTALSGELIARRLKALASAMGMQADFEG